jgi:hypothetical protein
VRENASLSLTLKEAEISNPVVFFVTVEVNANENASVNRSCLAVVVGSEKVGSENDVLNRWRKRKRRKKRRKGRIRMKRNLSRTMRRHLLIVVVAPSGVIL